MTAWSNKLTSTQSILSHGCRYCHNQDWDAAMRIAEQYDPTSISDVLVAQARMAEQRKQLQVSFL